MGGFVASMKEYLLTAGWIPMLICAVILGLLVAFVLIPAAIIWILNMLFATHYGYTWQNILVVNIIWFLAASLFSWAYKKLRKKPENANKPKQV